MFWCPFESYLSYPGFSALQFAMESSEESSFFSVSNCFFSFDRRSFFYLSFQYFKTGNIALDVNISDYDQSSLNLILKKVIFFFQLQKLDQKVHKCTSSLLKHFHVLIFFFSMFMQMNTFFWNSFSLCLIDTALLNENLLCPHVGIFVWIQANWHCKTPYPCPKGISASFHWSPMTCQFCKKAGTGSYSNNNFHSTFVSEIHMPQRRIIICTLKRVYK